MHVAKCKCSRMLRNLGKAVDSGLASLLLKKAIARRGERNMMALKRLKIKMNTMMMMVMMMALGIANVPVGRS